MKIFLQSVVALVALPAVAGMKNKVCCHIPDGDCSVLTDDADFSPLDSCVVDEDDAMSVGIGTLGRRACTENRFDPSLLEAEDEVDMTYCKLPSDREFCTTTCDVPNTNGEIKTKTFKKGVKYFTDIVTGLPIGDPEARCLDKLALFECKIVECTIDCEGGGTATGDVGGFVRTSSFDETEFCNKIGPRILSKGCPKVERTHICCDQDGDCLDGCDCWEMRGETWQHKSHKGFCWDTYPKFFTATGLPAPHRTVMCMNPVCVGDPHFRTWGGKWYDYHGECDLVLAKDTSFEGGKGLDIHIRTKARFDMSFIESAAIKIGDELLFEVSSYGEYVLNGVEEANFDEAFPADAVYTMNHTMMNKKEHHYDILKNGKSAFHIKTHKDYVSVEVKIRLPECQGMLGDYVNGDMLARDGITVISNPNEFGQEWQVGPEDPVIFKTNRFPQHPQKCILPEQKKLDHRTLGENGISKEAAHEACAHWGDQKHMCAFDVMRSGDMDMAAIGPH